MKNRRSPVVMSPDASLCDASGVPKRRRSVPKRRAALRTGKCPGVTASLSRDHRSARRQRHTQTALGSTRGCAGLAPTGVWREARGVVYRRFFLGAVVGVHFLNGIGRLYAATRCFFCGVFSGSQAITCWINQSMERRTSPKSCAPTSSTPNPSFARVVAHSLARRPHFQGVVWGSGQGLPAIRISAVALTRQVGCARCPVLRVYSADAKPSRYPRRPNSAQVVSTAKRRVLGAAHSGVGQMAFAAWN